MWTLPWGEIHYKDELSGIQRQFPDDIIAAPDVNDLSCVKGGLYTKGEYIDEWGCIFRNLEDGIIGEVSNPIVPDISSWESFTPPYHILPENEQKAIDEINRFYTETDKFVTSACFPRPWERYQFLRGTENSLIDYMIAEKEFQGLLNKIHGFYMKEFELWSKTDVDALTFIDDWGTQSSLFIEPGIWREYFKPIYREYCDRAHSAGKFIFMHSDGNIQSIFPDLIEIGVDAINSQLFVMDMEHLAKIAKGNITFWGEIDRQHILNSSDPDDVIRAVNKVANHLYDPSGGIIAQFEFGPGIIPLNAKLVFEQWEKVCSRHQEAWEK